MPTFSPAFSQLRACTERALAVLAAPGLSDERVHEARKALKRARACLRLLRPALDRADYRGANAGLRDAGRCLAPLRDAHSQLELLQRCRQAYDSQALDDLARDTAAERDRAQQHLADTRERALCRRHIERAQRHCQPAAQSGTQPLRRGLRDVYRKARKAFRNVTAQPTPALRHEWRKQVKYLRNAASVLHEAGIRGLGKPIKRLVRIAELLGDDHDLVVLRQALQSRAAEADEVLASIGQRAARLSTQALRLGDKSFVLKSRQFAPSKRAFERATRGASSNSAGASPT